MYSSWQKSKYNLADDPKDGGGALQNTVNQVYTFDVSKNDVLYGSYSDQPANNVDHDASSSYAHSKGMLVSDVEGGFYLTHSCPHWPGSIEMGPTVMPSLKYGQTYECISIDSNVADQLAGQMSTNHPWVYDQLNPVELASEMPLFASWLNKEASKYETNVIEGLSSFNGEVKFSSFAKSGSWGKDLYDDLVGPYFKSPLYVETFRDGSGGRMPSICTNTSISHPSKTDQYDVYEIATIQIEDVNFKGTTDHAKFALGADGAETDTLLCIGDLNRMCSQEKRGGGAICRHDNAGLYKAFLSSIASVETCWEYNPCPTSSVDYGSGSICYWC